MNGTNVNKKVTTGLPRKKNAEDIAPTTKEILRLIEYTDTRLMAIVLTMDSSGIRLGVGIF